MAKAPKTAVKASTFFNPMTSKQDANTDAITEAFRSMAEVKEGVTDAQIWLAAGLVAGKNYTEEEVSAMLVSIEALTSIDDNKRESHAILDVSASERNQDASRFGAMVDAEMSKDLDAAPEGVEMTRKAPIITANHIARLYGERKDKDGKITRPDMVLGGDDTPWPMPDTRKHGKAPNVPATYNLPLDWTKEGKYKAQSWYTDFYLASPFGRKTNQQLEWLKTIEAGKHADGAPDDWNNLDATTEGDKETIKAHRQRLMSHTVNAVKQLRRAVRFYIQQRLIAKELPKVGWKFSTQPDTSIAITKEQLDLAARSPNPICVYAKGGDGGGKVWRPISLTSFNKLDVAKAVRGDGSAAALIKTLERPPQAGSDNKKKNQFQIHVPGSKEEIDYLAGCLNRMFLNPTAKALLVTELNQDNGVALYEMGTLQDRINMLMEPYRDRYMRERAEVERQEREEAEAKRKATAEKENGKKAA